jgi:hypothetical protein
MPHDMRIFDPTTPRTVVKAKSVLRNMLRRRESKRLTKIAEATGIECEQLKSFRRGGDALSGLELTRLTETLLYGTAKYDADTDTLIGTEARGMRYSNGRDSNP